MHNACSAHLLVYTSFMATAVCPLWCVCVCACVRVPVCVCVPQNMRRVARELGEHLSDDELRVCIMYHVHVCIRIIRITIIRVCNAHCACTRHRARSHTHGTSPLPAPCDHLLTASCVALCVCVCVCVAVQAMIDEFDRDQDGAINEQEFMYIMKSASL